MALYAWPLVILYVIIIVLSFVVNMLTLWQCDVCMHKENRSEILVLITYLFSEVVCFCKM